MKRRYLIILSLVSYLISPLSTIAAVTSSPDLSQVFEETYHAYESFESLQAEISAKVEFANEQSNVAKFQAYLPFQLSFKPETGLYSHLEVMTGENPQPLYLAEAYLNKQEFGFFNQDVTQMTNQKDVTWQRRIITSEELATAQETWENTILPSIGDIYSFLFTLTKDKNIQQDFEMEENEQSYAITWQPQPARDLSFDHFTQALDALRDKGMPVENFNMSQHDFQAYMDLVSYYDIQIDLTVPKDSHLIEDIKLIIKPKSGQKSYTGEQNTQSHPLSNATIYLQASDIKYNEDLTLERPEDGQFLPMQIQGAPILEDREAMTDFQNKARSFRETHIDSLDKVTKSDIEKAFDISVSDSGASLQFNLNNGLYAYPIEDGIEYSIFYEDSTASQTYNYFTDLFDHISRDPHQIRDPKALLDKYPLPDKAQIHFISEGGHGFSYIDEGSTKELSVSYLKSDQPSFRIVVDYQGELEKLTYDKYKANDGNFNHIDDWIDAIGPYNGISNTKNVDQELSYIWSESRRDYGKTLQVTTDFEGNITDSYFME